MKKTALLAATVALAAASPAMADGYLGARYTTSDVDVLGIGGDAEGWQGEGELGFVGGGWGAQFGGAFGNIDLESDDTDYWTGNAHLYLDAGSWKIGGVIAATSLDDADSDETVFGIEAMVDLGPNTNLWGSTTFGESDFLGGADVDTWNLDVGGNFYASPNVRFGANVGAGNLEGGGTDVDTMSAGVNTEFQPWSAPLSITLAYNYYDIDDLDTSSSGFSIGVRWNFGGGTLQERDSTTPFTTNSGNVNRLLGAY